MTDPTLHHVHVNGVRLACFEHGVPAAGRPTLLLVHATGFHGRIWDHIAEALPGQHIVALEQRGHGRSGGGPIEDWRVFGEDMAAFVAQLGLSRLIGVGHSMGAHAMIDAAAHSDAFARLVLLDPTVSDPATYDDVSYLAQFGAEGHPAARRRDRFDSVEQMRARLQGKSSFDLYHPRIFADYCEHALVPDGDGGLRLACAPAMEASVYAHARSNPGVFDSARALRMPVTVVRAQAPAAERGVLDWASSPTWPRLWCQFPRGRELHWSTCTHFIPMQMPERVITLLRAEIDAWHRAR